MYEDCEVLASMVAGEDGVLLPSQGSDFSDIHINFHPSSPLIISAKQDWNDNLTLRAENEKLKNENLQLQAAIKALICPNCNNMGYDEQLRLENVQLKIELQRVGCFGITSSQHIQTVEATEEMAPWLHSSSTILFQEQQIDNFRDVINQAPLMCAELQFPSPLVPTREALFLCYCQLNKEERTWVIVDFPFESMDGSCQPSSPRYKRRPSGCIIKDLPNGCFKVTSAEQAEVEYTPIHKIFHLFINSGRAFEAQHWLVVLQRQSERLASLVATNVSNLGGMQITEARKKLMNLAKMMTKTLFVNMSSSCGQTWMALSNCADHTIRITTRSITEPCLPIGLILAVASTSWLPYSTFLAFNLVKDEHCRALQLDVLSNVTSLQEVVHIASGSHLGNCDTSTKFILQESSISHTSGVVVFYTLNIDSLQLAMSNQDQSCIPLLPLGFIIHPMGALLVNDYSIIGEVNGVPNSGFESLPGQGCLLTLELQVLVSTNPTKKLEYSDIIAISKPLCDIVHKINTNSDRGGDDDDACANNGGNVGVSTKPVAQDEPSLQQD
ncbi:homeobox-leucine zipper protein ROC3-like [Diospyros lotus]|uniref:homeobox-leucine zipper protein ROC3-like n=1 Tax=Diospyros lotus TaxID=55363 RepID=UPI00225B3B9F|nr:homeobox-leucine zipper protein ROC3-like [Diospyros lotus]